MLTRPRPFRSRFALAGLAAIALGAACSGPGNTGLTPVSDELALQIPWVNGRQPLRDADGKIEIPSSPQYPGIASHERDLDPVPPADCAEFARQSQGLEFSTGIWFETFEPRKGGSVGTAEAWAAHDDKTEGSFFTPGELNAYKDLVPLKGAILWGLPAQELPGPKCDDAPNDWVFHFQGGRFNRFGAGVEHPIALIAPDVPYLPGTPGLNCPADPLDPAKPSVVCPPAPAASDEFYGNGLPIDPTDHPPPYAQPELHTYWDLSFYDGISFWARRGPEGQGAFTTIIQDQHTSSDLNKENNQNCQRVKPCWSKCLNRAPCTLNEGEGIYRCFDPADGDLSDIPATPGGGAATNDSSLLDQVAPRCGKTACSSPTTFLDPDFDGKACRPFTFNTHESGEYCFNENDPAPPSSGERCGDGYAKEVTLTPYWKFYKIRFSELRQQGFGKVSPGMDLRSVHAVAFIGTHGWIDFFLDNVSFYREPR